MRRWHLCLALSFLSSVVYVPAADAAPSSEDRPGAIVSGLLTDIADNPVSGGVQLFAWPTGRPVEVGQTVELLPVGNDRAASDGRFAVAGDLTPDLAELARLNGGYINFVLQAAVAGVIEETHLSRYVGDTPITAQESGGARRPTEWRASPEEVAQSVRIRLNQTADEKVSQDRISPMQGGCSGNRLIESQIQSTVIGELRAPADTEKAEFVYGKSADSEIGVATRGGQGPWSLAGSFHVGNARKGEVRQRALSGEHLLVRSRFKYDKYETTCPTGRRERVVPREWFGDYQSQPTVVRGCGGAIEDNTGHFGPSGSFTRVSEKAVQWQGAVEVFGASLTARSGYSKYVMTEWSFGRAAADHLLCGDNGHPLKARHIFAGDSA